MTGSAKDGARNPPVYLSVERKIPTVEGECGRIAMQFEVADGDNFAARQKAAQLLIKSIRIARMLTREKRRAACDNG